MKRLWFVMLIALVLLPVSCSRLDQLQWDLTPEQWLETHHHIRISIGSTELVLAEPSSSLIVFGLAALLTAAGIHMLRSRAQSRSRTYWGIALLLWSLSTFFAGISYQIFSYMLKCHGRETCLWTTWWEIAYYFFFVLSMNFIVAAVARSSLEGKARTSLTAYAIINAVIYSIVLFTGALLPQQFLCSFECMILFVGPAFIVLLVVNSRVYRRSRALLERRLVWTWALLFLITAAYFLFLLSGIAAQLWAKGIWFNANDVLHLGLIFWCVYFLKGVAPHIRDC